MIPLYAHLACCARTAAAILLVLATGCATQAPSTAAAAPDSAELRAMFEADQADRQDITAINWHEVSERDAAREARVRRMLADGTVNTGPDYYHAAMVCQHSDSVEGIQLAHELAMISASLGDRHARWLAAASYDRLLHRLKQPQRFGTQYFQQGDEPLSLVEVSPGVTDSMRRALNVPTLEEAKAREAELRKSTPHP